MNNKQRTYRINQIIIGIFLWEVIFWGVYFVITSAMGIFTSSESEHLVYKSPSVFWLTGILLPIIILYIFNLHRTNKSVKNVAGRVQLLLFPPVSSINSFMKYFFFRNAFVLLIIALAQPVFGKKKVSGTTESLELVICLDVSNSMNTKDISAEISRLEISKRAITQLVNNLRGEKIGISLFANHAFVQLPLTRDYGAAKLFIQEIQTDMISSQGTNIDEALRVSEEMFSKEVTGKGIILITDGENHENKPDEVLNRLKDNNIQLSVLGIGTKQGGLIPKNPERPELGYKSDASGRSVVSKLNEPFVKEIASKSGGKAYVSSSEFPDLSALLTQIRRLKRQKINNLEFDVKQEQYQIPLFGALFCWLAFVLWSKNYIGMFKKNELKQ